MIHIVMGFLEVVIELIDIPLLFLHHVRGQIFNHSLLASLGRLDTPLLTIQDALLKASEQPRPHPLVDGQGHHLGDGGEAGDGPAIGGILSVAAFEDHNLLPSRSQRFSSSHGS